jgi:hypothetical protein
VTWLGIPWEGWLALYLVAVVWCCLFVAGASAMHDDEDTYGDLDTGTEEGESCPVIRFPVERSGSLDVAVPEYKPIIDGAERGWIA